MDWLELILGFVAAVAWPVVVLVALLVFHDAIRDMFRRLIQIKVPGVGVQLHHELHGLEKIPLEPPTKLFVPSSAVRAGSEGGGS